MKPIKYKEHKFQTHAAAHTKALDLKKSFGYMPEVFEVSKKSTGFHKFVVIEPHGLKLIKKNRR